SPRPAPASRCCARCGAEVSGAPGSGGWRRRAELDDLRRRERQPACAEEGRVRGELAVEGALPGELSEHAGARGGAERLEITLVETRDRSRHAAVGVGRAEHPGTLVEELRKGAGARRHYRTSPR